MRSCFAYVAWCFAYVAMSFQVVSGNDQSTSNRTSWITFLSQRSGDSLLYRMRPDGTECQPIFGGPIKDAPGIADSLTLYREPHWTWQSPDQQFLVSWATDTFRPRDASRSRSLFSLYLARADGLGPARILAPLCAEAAAWSPDSKRIAFACSSADVELGASDAGRPKTTRIYVVAIDGTADEMIFEQTGYWQPEDWSPEGQKLMLLDYQRTSANIYRSNLVELDLNFVKRSQETAAPLQQWQRSLVHRMKPLLGEAVPVALHGGRYSPDGRWIATISFPKEQKVTEWRTLDFELGVIDRTNYSYQKVARYPTGLRGPICWSPDSQWILFSRPMKADESKDKFAVAPHSANPESELGIWMIRFDGTDERFLTPGWSPDWR